jgi:hypothetical protein
MGAGWLEFVRRFLADKGKSTSVLLTLNLQPGAKHPICLARIKTGERKPAFLKGA